MMRSSERKMGDQKKQISQERERETSLMRLHFVDRRMDGDGRGGRCPSRHVGGIIEKRKAKSDQAFLLFAYFEISVSAFKLQRCALPSRTLRVYSASQSPLHRWQHP